MRGTLWCMFDGGSRSRVAGGSGGRDGNCCEGSRREGWKRSVKMGVDLLCVNKIKAVQVGQDVCRLLESMKLIEGNSSSMDESSLVGVRLHREEQRRGPAAEVAGWSSEWRSTGIGTA